MKKIKLDLDDLERSQCLDNEYGIVFGDIFFLRYQDINVFFYVCGTTSSQVRLYELAKKKRRINGKTVNTLCCGLKPTQSPNIITENNCWHKSTFWVNIKDDEHIFIPIESNMPIYHKTKYPYLGDFEAIKLTDEEKQNGVLNYYWEI